jgi:hypothetical protein
MYFFLYDFSRSLCFLGRDLVRVFEVLALVEIENLMDFYRGFGNLLRLSMIWLLNHFLEPRLSRRHLLDLTFFFTRFIHLLDVFSHGVFTNKLFTFLTWLLVFHFDDFLGVFSADGLLGALVHAYVLDVEYGVTRLLVGAPRLLLCLVLRIPSLFLPLLTILLGL